ncbi:hypothetical protein RJ641_015314 [Dillenia turbinata]|uniref:Uncharacterized protein n=1 Tax=Dillenia turbinata TaxID=194707 RepID=A0AAN8Z0Z0_9MAGN
MNWLCCFAPRKLPDKTSSYSPTPTDRKPGSSNRTRSARKRHWKPELSAISEEAVPLDNKSEKKRVGKAGLKLKGRIHSHNDEPRQPSIPEVVFPSFSPTPFGS